MQVYFVEFCPNFVKLLVDLHDLLVVESQLVTCRLSLSFSSHVLTFHEIKHISNLLFNSLIAWRDLLFSVSGESCLQLLICKSSLNQQSEVIILHILRVAEFFETTDLLLKGLVKLCDPLLEPAVEVINHFAAVGSKFRLHILHRRLEVLICDTVRQLLLNLRDLLVN